MRALTLRDPAAVGVASGLSIVQDGLIAHLDAGNPSSYSGSGTTWTDLSGNGRNATLVNAPTYSSANQGSIVFDGSNDYASLGTFTNFGSSNRSISVWFKVVSLPSSAHRVISFPANDASTDTPAFVLGISSAGVIGGGVGGPPYDSYSNYTTAVFGAWYNVTISVAGNVVTTYLNGLLVGVKTNTGSVSASPIGYIGRYNGFYGQYLSGQVSHLAVYNRALSASEALQNYNALKARYEFSPASLTGIVGWWDASDASTFTYSSGTSVSEWSSKVGPYKFVQSTASKQPSRSAASNGNTCISFDGTSDSMNTSTSVDMTGGGQKWSIFYVAAPSSAGTDNVIVEQTSDYNSNPGAFLSYRVSNNNVEVSKKGDGGTYNAVQIGTLTTSPKSIIGTHDGTLSTNETNAWINGVSGVSRIVNGNTIANNINSPVYLGARNNSSFFFNGKICEFGITTSVLTATEIADLNAYLSVKWLGFSPLDLSPALWLDASDDSTLTIDGSGYVSQWRDKSRNSTVASQGVAANQPLRIVAGKNGRSTIKFDGINDFLDTPAQAGLSTDRWIAAVVKPSATFRALFIKGTTDTDEDFCLYPGGGQVYVDVGNNSGPYQQTSVTWPTWAVIFAQHSRPGGTSSFTTIVNGTTYTGGVSGSSNAVNSSSSVYSIGKRISSFFDSEIAEFIVGNGTLSTADRTSIQSHLNAKWSVY